MPIDKKRLSEIVDDEIASRRETGRHIGPIGWRASVIDNFERWIIRLVIIRVENILKYIRSNRRLNNSDQLLIDIEIELEELIKVLRGHEKK